MFECVCVYRALRGPIWWIVGTEDNQLVLRCGNFKNTFKQREVPKTAKETRCLRAYVRVCACVRACACVCVCVCVCVRACVCVGGWGGCD